jgi:hypothetical protein
MGLNKNFVNKKKLSHGFQIAFFSIIILITNNLSAQNPLVMDQFTADPTARVFEGKIYIYPSHDILAEEGKGKIGWFCMADYHVFSSENLTDWTDHGVIVSQNKVDWVDSTSYSMWAPDCIYRNGKYYFYFPAGAKDKAKRGGIGVAIADKPYGPFKPMPQPIEGIGGIDPNVFIDKDGQAYLISAMGKIFIAKLKDNMLELADKPREIENLPTAGLKEGPFLFERNGIYYLTYPHVQNKIERLEYATSNHPMGPYKVTGVIMDESPTGCWTNHQSIVEYKNQWYLFYHHNDLSPNFDKARSIRADSLFFNEDGTIKKVIPTLRGIGNSDASKKIQIDRYSLKSNSGATIDFLNPDTLKRFEGWKTILNTSNAWAQYNSVDFGNKKFNSINVRASSNTGGILQIRINDANASVVTEVVIPKDNKWNTIKAPITGLKAGIHNIVVSLKDNANVEIDWINFE